MNQSKVELMVDGKIVFSQNCPAANPDNPMSVKMNALIDGLIKKSMYLLLGHICEIFGGDAESYDVIIDGYNRLMQDGISRIESKLP